MPCFHCTDKLGSAEMLFSNISLPDTVNTAWEGSDWQVPGNYYSMQFLFQLCQVFINEYFINLPYKIPIVILWGCSTLSLWGMCFWYESKTKKGNHHLWIHYEYGHIIWAGCVLFTYFLIMKITYWNYYISLKIFKYSSYYFQILWFSFKIIFSLTC